MGVSVKMVIYGFIFVLCTALGVSFLIRNNQFLSKESLTYGKIRECEWLEKRFAYITAQDLAAYIQTGEAAGFSLGQIFHFMVSYPQELPALPKDHTNMQLVNDAWGRPLNFAWKTNNALLEANRDLIKKEMPIVIWSSGQNGTNEWGNGDDIFLKN